MPRKLESAVLPVGSRERGQHFRGVDVGRPLARHVDHGHRVAERSEELARPAVALECPQLVKERGGEQRRVAATVPTRWPERVSWAINYRYHDAPGAHVRIYRQHELEQKLERAGCFLRGSHHAHAFHSPYWWLKCAYGLDNPEAAPVKRYHDFLCHLIEHNPRWASVTERALNPVLGKSLVVYGEKVPRTGAKWGKRSLG